MREPLYEESLYGLLERLRHIRAHVAPRVRPLRKVQPLGRRSLQVQSPNELPTIKAIQEIATPSELKFLLCDLNAPEPEFQKFRSHGLLNTVMNPALLAQIAVLVNAD